jgi:SAM-dependent methyltransferase
LCALAEVLAPQEVMRLLPPGQELTEPLTLQWYLELDELRHRRQGRWIASLLEFGKHAGERLLGLGSCLGSDLVQYARHGAEVVAVCASADQVALLRRNFELRGLCGTFLHTTPACLPLESCSIDVVCLYGPLPDSAAELLDEVYRVLKPGGKVLAVLPARYDVDFWAGWLYPTHRLARRAEAPAGLLDPTARRFRGRDLKLLFHRFHEPHLYKRHLRRSDVPHLWRWLPMGLLERLMGRLLVFKAFKPVSAAIGEQAAA